MNFIIKEIKDKNTWEDFLLECNEKTFLDSWGWGDFQKKSGNKIWRFGIFEGSELTSVTLVIKVQARRGTFMFVPHGPNIKSKSSTDPHSKNKKSKILEILLRELKKITREEGASFIRIAPIWERNEENIEIFKNLGFKEAPIHMNPEQTWELDIRPSEEELLTKMRKTTRYLIRQAQKNKDIEILQSNNLKDIEKFNALYQETVDRHHFVPFSLDYLKNQFLSFSPDGQTSIFLGKYKDEIISSAIIVFWQQIAFYHHGASSLKHSKIPISYFLQWEAIKEAKRRGCQTYNFWGVAPIIENCKLKIENLKRHPWAGLTLFKMGFGGYKKEYVKTQDLPLSSKYWLTYIIERVRRTKRGL